MSPDAPAPRDVGPLPSDPGTILAEIARRTGRDLDSAERITTVVVAGLAHLSPSPIADLLIQRAPEAVGTAMPLDTGDTLDNLFEVVAERLDSAIDEAADHARTVAETIKRTLTEAEVATLKESQNPDVLALFEVAGRGELADDTQEPPPVAKSHED